MRKKQYISPVTELIIVVRESLMETASPGVGGSYQPSRPIEAKEYDIDEEPETGLPHYSPWEG